MFLLSHFVTTVAICNKIVAICNKESIAICDKQPIAICNNRPIAFCNKQNPICTKPLSQSVMMCIEPICPIQLISVFFLSYRNINYYYYSYDRYLKKGLNKMGKFSCFLSPMTSNVIIVLYLSTRNCSHLKGHGHKNIPSIFFRESQYILCWLLENGMILIQIVLVIRECDYLIQIVLVIRKCDDHNTNFVGYKKMRQS